MSGYRSIRLPACILASLALHAATAAIVAHRQDGRTAAAAVSKPPKPASEPPILGDAAGAASIDWIGFESPNPHIAPESEVNRPALAINAGPVAPPVPPAPPAAAAAAPSPAPAAEQPVPEPAGGIRLDAVEASDITLAAADQPALGSLFDQLRAMMAAQAQRPPESRPLEQARTEPQPRPVEAQPAPTPPAPQAGAADDPGAPSDREAAAASREPVAEVRLQSGHVVSASGLEIRTRKPQFETLTRLISNPANPVVRISFNRLGRVANVELLESSRYSAVDDPVVTAVYNWTAAGEPLLKLPQSDPNATVDVVIRILLR